LGADDFQNKNFSLRVELWRLVEIFVAHGAERIVVPSEYLKKIVLGWGTPEGDISVIYNSVPEIRFLKNKEGLRAELGLSGHVILSAGRLVPWKGFPVLFQVLKKLSVNK
jgi:glycosyltransferase involved in cell wall biosynthesis